MKWLSEPMQTGYTNIDERVRIQELDLKSFQGSASFEAPLKSEALVLSCIHFCVLAVLVSDSDGGVDWLGNAFRVTQPLLHIRTLCVCPVLFIIPVFLISWTEVRLEERSILERAGNVQSITVGLSPITVVLASVCTFSLHMALGYDLTAAEVFIYKNLQVCDKSIGKTNHKDSELQLCFVVCIKIPSPAQRILIFRSKWQQDKKKSKGHVGARMVHWLNH